MIKKLKIKKQKPEKRTGRVKSLFQLTKNSSIFQYWTKRRRFSWPLTTPKTAMTQWLQCTYLTFQLTKLSETKCARITWCWFKVFQVKEQQPTCSTLRTKKSLSTFQIIKYFWMHCKMFRISRYLPSTFNDPGIPSCYRPWRFLTVIKK